MLEQIDHRGKRFTIDDNDIVDDGRIDRCRRADALERQAQREHRELERAKAVAGPAAANLFTSNEAEPTVDDYTLIYDLDETPAPQLADRWPSLPAAVQVASAVGEQLLAAARDQTGWSGNGASERDQQAPTRLYDQRGNGIRDESRLNEVLDDADDERWLVPAIALTETAGRGKSDSQLPSGPTTEHLDCQNCGKANDHRFKTHESIPDETWIGQPIWECKVCGTARYGPALE